MLVYSLIKCLSHRLCDSRYISVLYALEICLSENHIWRTTSPMLRPATAACMNVVSCMTAYSVQRTL